MNPTMLLYLMAAHFVCDYPLQGDYLAKAKADGPLRVWHLLGHATIHGAAVCLITGSVWLGLAELVVHALADELKVKKKSTFAEDQAFHAASKIAWCAIASA
jgi:hypothetical protein